VTLALVALAPIARVTRRAVGEALASTPALAGRARGDSPWEETVRALRRAVPAFAGLGAALVPQLVAGSVLVERVFGLPGTGQLLADSVFARDLPTVLGLTLVSGLAVVAATLASDAAAALADPRIVDGDVS
jgi:peptide/nickel transport system permease protein